MATSTAHAWKDGDKVETRRRTGELIIAKVVKGNYAKGKGQWVDIQPMAPDAKGKLVPNGKPLCKRPTELSKPAKG